MPPNVLSSWSSPATIAPSLRCMSARSSSFMRTTASGAWPSLQFRDPKWQSAVPYTMLLGPDGKVLYSTLGSVDLLELRRKILAALPSDYIGFNQYWTTK